MSEENIVEDQNISEGVDPIETVEEVAGEPVIEEPDHAATVETLQQRLLTALVKADGRMQDPTDFPFNAEHLDNEESLAEAITKLLEAKPHLKKRTNHVTEDIGAGVRGDKPNDFDLLSVIRSMQ
ncbi:hypothetical protein CDES_14085 [Corynebacterium deserti GIMN1.010]|uniref:Uncharacterized protein n=1 Tax=Corynebacterium deserti GIMN1.010 TaxID=931089 RepID=A0A0M4CS78_9CORY|nr:hypothetical protein [Corynebacterium deserti]ALC07142.1 hypothetical protein CDES_14085 [Corynebacterium deserti GIMN1.010]